MTNDPGQIMERNARYKLRPSLNSVAVVLLVVDNYKLFKKATSPEKV